MEGKKNGIEVQKESECGRNEKREEGGIRTEDNGEDDGSNIIDQARLILEREGMKVTDELDLSIPLVIVEENSERRDKGTN
jgi:hypothetical protein